MSNERWATIGLTNRAWLSIVALGVVAIGAIAAGCSSDDSGAGGRISDTSSIQERASTISTNAGTTDEKTEGQRTKPHRDPPNWADPRTGPIHPGTIGIAGDDSHSSFRGVNSWHADGHIFVTDVTAGGTGPGQSVGTFRITRLNWAYGSDMPERTVEVPGAGPLRITKAPRDPKRLDWLQRHGQIEFTSRSGIDGVLHLADYSVTLSP